MTLPGSARQYWLPATLVLALCPAVHAAEGPSGQGQSAQGQAAETTAPGSAVQSLEATLAQTRSMHALVTQLVMDQDGRELQENQVVMQMQKPASFSWEITEPYNELMVTDGYTIWRYEPDLDQVTIARFNNDLDRTPVMLLNGDAASIAAAYEVSEAVMDDGNLRFVLQPLGPGSLFERMSLTFTGTQLREMQFEDSLGQQTSLSFDAVEQNLPIGSEQFTFNPPAGVDIIDNTRE